MISAWRGEPIGKMEDKEILLSPLPVQKPFPTIWIAAFGPLALKQAGNLGLPYLASPVETFNSLKENLSEYRKHLVIEDKVLSTKTPLMRTIFISENKETCNKVKASLTKENASRFRAGDSSVDSWAIVGSRNYVSEKLNKYAEELGIDYFIARGRIPRMDDGDQIKSHEALTEIFPDNKIHSTIFKSAQLAARQPDIGHLGDVAHRTHLTQSGRQERDFQLWFAHLLLIFLSLVV